MNTTKDSTEIQKENAPITKNQFYFETPLYEAIGLDQIVDDFMEGDVDGYNSFGGFDTTYQIYTSEIGGYSESFRGFHKITLTCKRKGESVLRFMVIKGKDFVMKVGQFPSLADIQYSKIGKKYNKVLDEDSLFELKRAIGLAAHGTGIGSFVYLRRIFERLINRTYTENVVSIKIPEIDFRLKNMEEKVEILKTYLPSQLLDMKFIYSILSKGIHELTEMECLAYFTPLKLAIELILEQKIEMDLKANRDQMVRDQIKTIHQKIGK